jgi:hypothetical protein
MGVVIRGVRLGAAAADVREVHQTRVRAPVPVTYAVATSLAPVRADQPSAPRRDSQRPTPSRGGVSAATGPSSHPASCSSDTRCFVSSAPRRNGGRWGVARAERCRGHLPSDLQMVRTFTASPTARSRSGCDPALKSLYPCGEVLGSS